MEPTIEAIHHALAAINLKPYQGLKLLDRQNVAMASKYSSRN